MTQEAVVTKLMPNNMAEVAVTRGTACGSNCGNCESCIFQNEIKTLAKNLIGAKPGQKVLIESKSSRVYKAIMLVYVLPLITLLAAFAAAYMAGASEGMCVLSSFLGLFLGVAIMVYTSRKAKSKTEISFDIICLD